MLLLIENLIVSICTCVLLLNLDGILARVGLKILMTFEQSIRLMSFQSTLTVCYISLKKRSQKHIEYYGSHFLHVNSKQLLMLVFEGYKNIAGVIKKVSLWTITSISKSRPNASLSLVCFRYMQGLQQLSKLQL